ncbi:MAG: helix-turn-helix transcriptional regulator [Promethearchaeota archaeon]
MQKMETKITGPLQMKILMLLKDETLCGVDIMKKLNNRSAGTIYPVLKTLREKSLINFRVEKSGSTQKKVYSLTETGAKQIKEYLVQSVRTFCCDMSLYVDKILEGIHEFVEIRSDQKIFCTLDYEEGKRFLKGANVTFYNGLAGPSDTFDLVISFIGVGLLLEKESEDIKDYLSRLYGCLKEGGTLLAIEVEKTNNIFANLFFENFIGIEESPGLSKEELKEILEKIEIQEAKIISRAGMLYVIVNK